MRTLLKIEPKENYLLQCTFNDGSKKLADISVYLNKPAFIPLQKLSAFNKVTNKSYFVEWTDYELDLSADTLWHIGKEC